MAWTAEQIAAAIAKIESNGNYTAHSRTSSASGKYQYIDSTWNGYGGYAHAWQAPPSVQDARALHDITDKLHRYGGDASKVIMSWFLPAAVGNPTLANRVPKGNGISPNQYVARVMKALGVTMPTPGGGKQSSQGEGGDIEYEDDRPSVYGTMEGQLANLMAAITSPTERAF